MTEQEVKFLTTPSPRITKKRIAVAGAITLAVVATVAVILNSVNSGSDSETDTSQD